MAKKGSQNKRVITASQSKQAKLQMRQVIDSDTIFTEVMVNESDRGCILVAMQVLADALQRLLTAKFKSESGIHDDDVAHLFEGPLAMLNSLASRANLAYSLGLIDSGIWDTIYWLRQLRNVLAHSKGSVSLTSKAAGQIVSKLEHKSEKRRATIVATDFMLSVATENKQLPPEKECVVGAAVIAYLTIINTTTSLEKSI